MMPDGTFFHITNPPACPATTRTKVCARFNTVAINNQLNQYAECETPTTLSPCRNFNSFSLANSCKITKNVSNGPSTK